MLGRKILPLALWLLICLAGGKAEAQIAVIVNKNNPTTDMSLQELAKVFSGKTTSLSNGKRVRLGEYDSSRKRFYRVVLHKSVERMKKHWISLVFSGGSAIPPKTHENPEKVQDFMGEYEGAICFVPVAGVPKSTKILRIEGKLPGAANYPIK